MKKLKTVVVLLLSILLTVPPSAIAGVIGTITYVEGRVDKLASGASRYLPVVAGEKVSPGDKIRTKSYSKTEISFDDDSVVRLAPTSQIKVAEYEIDQEGFRKKGVIDLDRGRMRAIVSKTRDRTNFTINTPNASGSVKGSDVFVSFQMSATGILVAEGVLQTVNPAFPEQTLDIKEGSASIIPYDGPPQAPRTYLSMEQSRYEDETGPKLQMLKNKNEERTLVQIGRVTGHVKILPMGAVTYHAAARNEILNTGDKIQTGAGGSIEIHTDNGHIVTLKGNTQLILTVLTRDPKTGAYENLMECKKGRVIAKLSKIEGKSSFHIKTPSAVCGVRGTIMFLNVLPALTTAFFEGGDGYMKNLVTGVTKTILAGYTSSVDIQGNFSDPRATNDADRRQFGSSRGDEGSDDAQGYSPAGDVPDNGGDPTEADPAGNMADPGDPTDNGNEPFDDVLPNTGNGGDNTPSFVTLLANFEGTFGNFGDDGERGLSDGGQNFITATILGTTSVAPWAGISRGVLTGTYSRPERLMLWGGFLEGAGSDGGSLLGFMGGAWHSWEGVLASLYIDPTGIAGVLFGYFSGGNNDDPGIFGGSGDLFTIPVTALNIPPAVLSDVTEIDNNEFEVRGSFNGGAGYLDGEFLQTLMFIAGQPWGIWAGLFGAHYDRPDGLSEWIGVFGGIGDSDEDGFFIGSIEGRDDLESTLLMDVLGTYITPLELGTYFGTIVGAYEESGSYDFEGIGAGGWTADPLTFNGVWGREEIETNLYYNDGGQVEHGGSNYGLIGAIASPWDGPVSFVAMGRFYYDKSEGGDPNNMRAYIWNTPLMSYNATKDNYTTIDGGAFSGYSGGLWNNGAMTGSLAALYIDPDGNAGFLISEELHGNYYIFTDADDDPDGLWRAEGTLTATQMIPSHLLDGIDPEDFADYLESGQLTAEVEGSFGGFDTENGFIEGIHDWGEIIFLDVEGEEEYLPWGIYDIKLRGPETYSNPTNAGTWFAFLEGTTNFNGENSLWEGGMGGIWADGEIIGGMRGIFVDNDGASGIISGDVFGLYNQTEGPAGTWIAESTGFYRTMSYAEDAEFYDSEMKGAGLGGFDAGGLIDIIEFSGETLELEDQHWGIWGADFSGTTTGPLSPQWNAGLTVDADDDVIVLGTIDGSDWSSMRLKGTFGGYFFSAEDDGVLGLGAVTGDVFGAYEIEGEDTLFNAIGVGEWKELAELETDILGFDMEDLFELTDIPITEVFSDILSGTGAFAAGGAINGAMDISFFADVNSALEGIWAAMISGTYSAPASDAWVLTVTSGDTQATLTGSEWSDNEWLATVEGTGPNGIEFSGGAGGTYTDTDPSGTGTFEGAGTGTFGPSGAEE